MNLRLLRSSQLAVLLLSAPPALALAQGGLTQAPAWREDGTALQGTLGYGLASGDVNRDGFEDAMIGIPGQDDHRGRVEVYFASSAGLPDLPSQTIEGLDGEDFGVSVAFAGDVNGDGVGDVLVGACEYGSPAERGRAYLFYGSIAGLEEPAAWTIESPQVGANLGFFLGGVGDVDADGYDDFLVSSFLHDNLPHLDAGRVELFLGSHDGPVRPGWVELGDQQDEWFGSIAPDRIGDVNGDGYDDAVIGAIHKTDGGSPQDVWEGVAYLYLGAPGGLERVPAWHYGGGQLDASFGWSIAGGDVDGNGLADVVIGSPWYDTRDLESGRAFLFLGQASGLALAPAWDVGGNEREAFLGSFVEMADVNGDGYADVLVSAVGDGTSGTLGGTVDLYLGSAGGLAAAPTWTATSDNPGAGMGSVNAGGDINHDGRDDVLVAAPFRGDFDLGRVSLYYGLEEVCQAASVPLGVSCGAQLTVTPPTMGIPASVSVTQTFPNAPVRVYVTPAGALLPPQNQKCPAYVGFSTQDLFVGVSDAFGGFVRMDWTVPVNLSLCGAAFVLQAQVQPAPISSFHYRRSALSNGVRVTVGS